MFKNLTICGIQPEDQDEFRGEEDDPLRREIRPGLPQKFRYIMYKIEYKIIELMGWEDGKSENKQEKVLK